MKSTIEIWNRVEPLAPDWERLAEHQRANPFLWPGWIDAWWRSFGRGQLQILAVYQDGCLAGVLPLHRLRAVLSSTTNPEAPLFGFLAANEMAAYQLSKALYLQSARRIDLSLTDLADVGISQVLETADAAGYRVFTDTVEGSPYVTVHGTSWDAYESGLRRKFRSELRRRRRRLEEEGRLVLQVFDGKERLEELLEEGLRVEGSGWKDTAGTSIYARPAARHFYKEVAHWAAERGWLRLAFLRLNGRALAFDYCLECYNTHYLLKTGYDPAYKKFAPGMIIRHLMLARSFSEGLGTYDFLGVPDAWKSEWTSTHQKLMALRMFAPTMLGSLDRFFFVGGRSGYELARSFAYSPILPERARHLLKRGHMMWHRRLGRRRTS